MPEDKRKGCNRLKFNGIVRFRYEFFVARRYLKANRRRSILSIVSFISMSGVAVGVMALIIVLAVMSGFEGDLRDKILGTNSHIVVLKHGTPGIEKAERILEIIKGVEGVRAASPFIYSQAMISTKRNVSGVVIRGIDPDLEMEVTDLEKNMLHGALRDLDVSGALDGKDKALSGIILGVELARNLAAGMGSKVTIISPMGKMGPMGMLPRMKKMRVVGIFSSGMYEYDNGLAYISMKSAQKFFRMGDKVLGIGVKVFDVSKARETANAMKEKLGFPYWVRDWMDMNRNLFSALKLEKMAMFIILVLIILVAAFNIVGNLIMVVMEKNKDIAILKTMGATSKSIMRVFMLEGLIIGLTGTSIGGLLGTVTCYIFDHFKLISLQADVYYISYLPFKMQFFDVFSVCAVSIFISFLATLYPSLYAARLDPVVALRHE